MQETVANRVNLAEEDHKDESRPLVFEVKRIAKEEKDVVIHRTETHSVFINNIETDVTSDLKAECCVMLETRANELEIEANPNHPGRTLYFVKSNYKAKPLKK